MNDLRYAVRQLLRHRGFTAVAVLTLALGIGANTAIFSVVDKVLLHPLPFEDADRMVEIREMFAGREAGGVSPPVYMEIAGLTNVFLNVTSYRVSHLSDFMGKYPELYWGHEVTPDFFDWLHVNAWQGRTFRPEEGRKDNDQYIILSEGFWERRYGANHGLIGQTISLAPNLGVPARPYTVVGIMPKGFRFPSQPGGGSDFWTPHDLKSHDYSGWQAYANKNWAVAARLAPGVSPEQAQAVLNTVAQRHVQLRPRLNKDLAIRMRPLGHAFSGENVQKTLWGLTGAIGFVLLIACANLSNLQLTRMETRRKEVAIRTALGATRRQLLRQLLTENLLLALAGGALGLLVAWWGMGLLIRLVPEGLPQLKEIRMDGRVLGFTLLLSTLSGLLFGLAPSWRPIRERLTGALKEGGHTSHVGGGRQYVRHGLIISQVALAMVLLTGASLMVQSVVRLLHVDPGFDPENLVLVSVVHMKNKGPGFVPMDREQYAVFLNEMREQLGGIPGVAAVGSETESESMASHPDFLRGTDTRPRTVRVARVGTGELDYFRAHGIEVLRGRTFADEDLSPGATTIIVNEAMRREFWPGTAGLGERLRLTDGKGSYTVIGVVPDVKRHRLDEEAQPFFYEPASRVQHVMSTTFMVRTKTDPATVIQAIRTRLWEWDKNLPAVRAGVVETGLLLSAQVRQTYMWCLVAFAAVGLVLAWIGIYGVLAYGVTRRTQEFGIRMALGAQTKDLLRLVMSEGMRVVLLGVIVGLAAANWLTQFLAAQLYDVTATDPWVFGGVAMLMATVALAACFLPARKAGRLHPMQALRYE